MDDVAEYLKATPILDYTNPELVKQREHVITLAKNPKDKIKLLYNYVSSLPLKYSINDNIPASRVLHDASGQCNTKTTLLMALARGAGIPCRVHSYRLTKKIQRSRHSAWLVALMPRTTLFMWPEFYVGNKWVPLQKLVYIEKREVTSCPFDGAKHQLEPLKKEWIVADHGAWPSQDAYFAKHKPSATGMRQLGFRLIGRRIMNKRLKSC